ncbi:hypothetical protein B0H12DRAFT_1260510 [Mycena haematopus]|nr:hypothetical protein B0H12DRAFT_1260510 [Mycena haematopus]
MYPWPTNHTPNRGYGASALRKGRAKGKEKAFIPDLNYPVLEHGTLAAATVLEVNGRLEWTHITHGRKAASKGLKTSKPIVVFPATRPAPFQLPRMSITQRAEQGANFLRTYAPSIDIASDLIRDQLTADAATPFARDPYVGNSSSPPSSPPRTKPAFWRSRWASWGGI